MFYKSPRVYHEVASTASSIILDMDPLDIIRGLPRKVHKALVAKAQFTELKLSMVREIIKELRDFYGLRSRYASVEDLLERLRAFPPIYKVVKTFDDITFAHAKVISVFYDGLFRPDPYPRLGKRSLAELDAPSACGEEEETPAKVHKWLRLDPQYSRADSSFEPSPHIPEAGTEKESEVSLEGAEVQESAKETGGRMVYWYYKFFRGWN